MEGYQPTKEEREKIKEIGMLGIKARKIIKEYKTAATLLSHLYDEEFTKLEQTGKIQSIAEREYRTSTKMCKPNVRKSLEEDLELCKKLQNEDIISVIAKDATDESKYAPIKKGLTSYVEKLKPTLQEYITLLEGRTTPRGRIRGAIELAKWNEEYAQKLELFLQGKLDFNELPSLGGETRSEELKQQDKENHEKMKNYHKAEDKTGLELPVAEGLKEPTEEKKTGAEEKPAEKKVIPKSSIPFKKISAETLIALVDNYLMQDGIAEPGMLKKGYIRCTNKDMQNFAQIIDYDTYKKLDMVPCSEENSSKLFGSIKPRYTLSIDMYYGDAVLKDTKTGKSKILDLKLKNFGKS
ncbi:MAG: hypothetical protein Q8O03_04915 [Nanoarchaeota archaeon]|nr:hypothetical protein [Nanoarchaeota archaeon]